MQIGMRGPGGRLEPRQSGVGILRWPGAGPGGSREGWAAICGWTGLELESGSADSDPPGARLGSLRGGVGVTDLAGGLKPFEERAGTLPSAGLESLR